MKLFIANVGVNSNDARRSGLKSPVYNDGTFEFVPIKESKVDAAYSSLKYNQLNCFNNKNSFTDFLPLKYHDYIVHNDPEFITYTYGDILTPRSSNLENAQKGDYLFFLARLYRYTGNSFIDESGFYFIGYFVIEYNLLFDKALFDSDESIAGMHFLKNNVHFIKHQNGLEKPFRIIVGNGKKSVRFKKALKITPSITELLFNSIYDEKNDCYYSNVNKEILKNKNDKIKRYLNFHSITRSIQYYLDSSIEQEKEMIEKILDVINQTCL